jgi:hypothetical protein
MRLTQKDAEWLGKTQDLINHNTARFHIQHPDGISKYKLVDAPLQYLAVDLQGEIERNPVEPAAIGWVDDFPEHHFDYLFHNDLDNLWYRVRGMFHNKENTQDMKNSFCDANGVSEQELLEYYVKEANEDGRYDVQSLGDVAISITMFNSKSDRMLSFNYLTTALDADGRTCFGYIPLGDANGELFLLEHLCESLTLKIINTHYFLRECLTVVKDKCVVNKEIMLIDGERFYNGSKVPFDALSTGIIV